MILRKITIGEIQEAVTRGVIIEDYPDDKYGSSCLILGFMNSKRPLHIQCSYPSRLLIKIITTYEPDEQHWVDLKIGRVANE